MIDDISSPTYETAYAKLNIALHVRNRLPNGYHELETVFVFLDKGDKLSVEPSDVLSLTISGPFSDRLEINDNLVLSAARLLQENCNLTTGANLHLVKNLPVASGIGGGSADAAAALRLLNQYWQLGLQTSELEEIAKPLGADVPACIASETAIGLGIGQDLKPLNEDYLSGLHVLLANPLTSVSTKEIFEGWNGNDLGPLDLDDMSQVLIHGRNDLQPIAMNLDASISPLLKTMEETNPMIQKMSGSGATCFAMYKTEELALAAEAELQSQIDKVWTLTGQLR